MNEFIESSAFFGVFISFTAYYIGIRLKKRFNYSLCNPLIIAIIIVISFLLICNINVDAYTNSSQYITYLLTPATICLAVPLYEQFEMLKHNYKAILAGITMGVLGSMLSILGLSIAFGLSHIEYVTFLPKSITTALGIGVSEELGGYISITVISIVITGISGNIFADKVLSLFKITEPVAKGIALGTASHAMGTVKAMEMGPIEGAMSSLSIVVAGFFTVIGASVFANLL